MLMVLLSCLSQTHNIGNNANIVTRGFATLLVNMGLYVPYSHALLILTKSSKNQVVHEQKFTDPLGNT